MALNWAPELPEGSYVVQGMREFSWGVVLAAFMVNFERNVLILTADLLYNGVELELA